MTTPATPGPRSDLGPVAPWWKRAFAAWWPSLAIVAADQVSKILVTRLVAPGSAVEILGSWVIITHQLNPAGAMSIRLGPPWFYLVVTAGVVLFLAWTLLDKPTSRASRLALWLVLGGAVGNMIDRLRLGAVIDFVDVEFFDFSLPAVNFGPIHVPGDTMTRWPVFNVADASVTIGIAILILATLVLDRRHDHAQGESD